MAVNDDDDEGEIRPLTEVREGAPDGFTYGFYPWVDTGVGMSYQTYLEILQWCQEKYGSPATPSWHHERSLWTEVRTGIWFKHADQAMEFKLRWL